MRIATYNVNGIRARLPVLMQWLQTSTPHVVCLQELKCDTDQFPERELQSLGYACLWHGQKAWNGVAILAKGTTPLERRRVLPGDPDDLHSRYIEAQVGELIVSSLYLPNGNPAPGPRFDYKLSWFERLLRHSRDLLHEEQPVVMAGDFNVIPTDLDVYAPDRWRDDALFRPEVRSAYAQLLAAGWSDAIRERYPTQRIYTFWKYFRGAFARDAGLRIDHLLLNATLLPRLRDAGVERSIRALEKTSDHAPVWIELDL